MPTGASHSNSCRFCDLSLQLVMDTDEHAASFLDAYPVVEFHTLFIYDVSRTFLALSRGFWRLFQGISRKSSENRPFSILEPQRAQLTRTSDIRQVDGGWEQLIVTLNPLRSGAINPLLHTFN